MLGLLRTPPTFDNSAGYEFSDGTQRNYRNGEDMIILIGLQIILHMNAISTELTQT